MNTNKKCIFICVKCLNQSIHKLSLLRIVNLVISIFYYTFSLLRPQLTHFELILSNDAPVYKDTVFIS